MNSPSTRMRRSILIGAMLGVTMTLGVSSLTAAASDGTDPSTTEPLIPTVDPTGNEQSEEPVMAADLPAAAPTETIPTELPAAPVSTDPSTPSSSDSDPAITQLAPTTTVAPA